MVDNNKKNFLTAFTSPVGEAVFPWLTKVDTKHDAAGVYHTDLSVPFELADDFIAKLEKVRSDFVATLPIAQQSGLVPRPVYNMELTRPEFPKDASDMEKDAIRVAFEPQETGNVLFRFKLKSTVTPASGETFTQKPVIVMADTGAAVEEPVYGGSMIRVRGQIVPYTNAMSKQVGVTLRLKAVQVLELVTGSGEGSGFWTDFDNDSD